MSVQIRQKGDPEEQDLLFRIVDPVLRFPGDVGYSWKDGRRGYVVNIIVSGVLFAVLFVVFITVKFAWEIHANNQRIRRGEAPKKYGDATDIQIVDVIDWTRR